MEQTTQQAAQPADQQTERQLWLEAAFIGDQVETGVLLSVAGDGTISQVGTGITQPPAGAQSYRGLALPGAANAHSHAFHRLLRARTHADGGTFWTWRQVMYRAAAQLNPENYFTLARAVYTEMVTAGYTSVGEFHYVHHQPGGTPYGGHEMELALAHAAAEVGIRLVLLDTCYLTGAIGEPLSEEQARFGDGDIDGYLKRHASLEAALRAEFPNSAELKELTGAETNSAHAPGSAGSADAAGTAHLGGGGAHITLGAAIHSVRAVPAAALPAFADTSGALHVHLSEQPAENEACLAAYGMTPTGLLAEAGLVTDRLAAVHATHLTDEDISLLGSAGAGIVMCPTTEADLADGIGPARRLANGGAVIALGSDQHVVLDPLQEVRALEYGERLASGERGRFSPHELLAALTQGGQQALRLDSGLQAPRLQAGSGSDAGSGVEAGSGLRVGAPADFMVVRTDTVRTTGSVGIQALMAATAADISHVIIGGREAARDGIHPTLGDPGELYREAFAAFDLGTDTHDTGPAAETRTTAACGCAQAVADRG